MGYAMVIEELRYLVKFLSTVINVSNVLLDVKLSVVVVLLSIVGMCEWLSQNIEYIYLFTSIMCSFIYYAHLVEYPVPPSLPSA